MALTQTSHDSHRLSEQGSIDWVTLSRTTYSATIAVLGRLAGAGLEPLTVEIACAISRDLPLGLKGEANLKKALSKLQSFSSFSDAVYFGFGVRHVLRSLVQTSQGSASVALIACLSEGYSPGFAASAIYEITKLYGLPFEITPSFSQWEKYAQTCSGIFATSTFGQQVEQIAQLANAGTRSYRLNFNGIECRKSNMKAKEMAEILRMLGKVSKNEVECIEIIGDIECCWIVVLCDFLLGLRVRFYAEDEVRFQNYNVSTEGSQVDIRFFHHLPTSLICKRQTFKLGLNEDVSRRFFTNEPKVPVYNASQLNGRLAWDSFISNSFDDTWTSISEGPRKPFVEYFTALAAVYCNAVDVRYDTVAHFLDTALELLPELRPLRSAFNERLCEKYISSRGSPNPDLIEHYLEAERLIRSYCSCANCHSARGVDNCFGITMCYTLLTIVIVLGELVIHDDLKLTRSGVKLLFQESFNCYRLQNSTGGRPQNISKLFTEWLEQEQQVRGRRYEKKQLVQLHKIQVAICSRCSLFRGRSIDDLENCTVIQTAQLFSACIQLFSGASLPNLPMTNISAAAANGIVCYSDILLGLSDEKEARSRIHVKCGSIQFSNRLYNTIHDQSEDRLDMPPNFLAEIGSACSHLGTTFHALAEESITLRFWYEVYWCGKRYSINPSQFLNQLHLSRAWKRLDRPRSDFEPLLINEIVDNLVSTSDLWLRRHFNFPEDCIGRCIAVMNFDSYYLIRDAEEFRLFVRLCMIYRVTSTYQAACELYRYPVMDTNFEKQLQDEVNRRLEFRKIRELRPLKYDTEWRFVKDPEEG